MKSRYSIDIDKNKNTLLKIIKEISEVKKNQIEHVERILQKNPSLENKLFSKTQVLYSYNKFIQSNNKLLSKKGGEVFLENIKMKKIRTISGVTPVTVLTKPFPCPGECIFCPNDPTMPKSYLPQEPGAQRANSNFFDPYFQTFNRLNAIKNMGHPTDKIELIILGGTWTSYPESYRLWFIKRCFDALNKFDPNKEYKFQKALSKFPYSVNLLKKNINKKYTYNQLVTLSSNSKKYDNFETEKWENILKVHRINETSKCRCVGLVIETRPDEINKKEVVNLRKLGVTKVQIGIQSTNDKVLKANKRGHTLSQAKKAVNLLRLAGFKIHIHWMPNLYKSNVKNDKKDFNILFGKSNIKPDELKVYPCSLINGTKLMDYYNKGKWRPYSFEELIDVLTYIFKKTPRYCRITRVVRDIPGDDIVVGNKFTNLRQIIEGKLAKDKIMINEIRSREIKDQNVKFSDLRMKISRYKTAVTNEIFLEYVTKEDKIVGFLRLSLQRGNNYIKELDKSSIIREVHVYGQSLEIGIAKSEKAQHIGLGKNLIKEAENISKKFGFKKMSVISSIGTRKYYEKNGFSKCDGISTLYQHKLI